MRPPKKTAFLGVPALGSNLQPTSRCIPLIPRGGRARHHWGSFRSPQWCMMLLKKATLGGRTKPCLDGHLSVSAWYLHLSLQFLLHSFKAQVFSLEVEYEHPSSNSELLHRLNPAKFFVCLIPLSLCIAQHHLLKD